MKRYLILGCLGILIGMTGCQTIKYNEVETVQNIDGHKVLRVDFYNAKTGEYCHGYTFHTSADCKKCRQK